jgi:hypothetical protein
MFRRLGQARKHSFAPAQIRQGSLLIDCVLKDISPEGARLQVANAATVPKMFELLLKNTGAFRPATVQWQQGDEIGVIFSPERRAPGRRGGSTPEEFAAAAQQASAG